MAMRRSTKMQLAKAAREGNMPGRKMEIEYERWDEPEQRYDRQPRSNWREPIRMEHEDMEMRRGQRRDRMGRFTNEYGGYAPYGPYGDEGRSNRAESEYDGAESRFRDRRGREHYDNGRFAPMRSDYFPNGPYMDHDYPFGLEQRGGDDMRPIGFNSDWGGEMRMGADATVPRYNEMEHMPGNRAIMGGYMAEHQHRKLDERTATEWVNGMKNADGTKAPHWTLDQVKQVSRQKGLDMEPVEVFAILNALYSDYDPIFKKHGVSTMDFYLDMAKAWLKDKDAVPNKAMAYYECIVK